MLTKQPLKHIVDVSGRVLIIARTARLLAQAAHAAGYRVFAADQFGDDDTLAVSEEFVPLRTLEDAAFDDGELMRLVETLTNRHGPLPIVLGAGFEAQSHLIAALSARFHVLGCDAPSVFAANDPVRVVEASLAQGLVAPKLRFHYPTPIERPVLSKSRGACGGAHVKRVHRPLIVGQLEYLQDEIEGQHLSACFCISRNIPILLGFCEQRYVDASVNEPYQFQTLISLPDMVQTATETLKEALASLIADLGLRGLCGIDFIYTRNGDAYVVDINPRAPASFDLLAPAGAAFLAHHAACDGRDYALETYADVRAKSVCYAQQSFKVPQSFVWPQWVSDRPPSGAAAANGAPICTVYANAPTRAETLNLLHRRVSEVTALAVQFAN